jgi:hypothetical protein
MHEEFTRFRVYSFLSYFTHAFAGVRLKRRARARASATASHQVIERGEFMQAIVNNLREQTSSRIRISKPLTGNVGDLK